MHVQSYFEGISVDTPNNYLNWEAYLVWVGIHTYVHTCLFGSAYLLKASAVCIELPSRRYTTFTVPCLILDRLPIEGLICCKITTFENQLIVGCTFVCIAEGTNKE